MFRPDDLFFAPDAAPAASGGIRLTWLGTAGFAIEHDGHVLLLDPYLPRASLGRCLLARSPDELAI